MKTQSHKLLWIGLVVAIILGATWQFFPLSSAQNRMDLLPLNGVHFRGMNVPLTPFEEQFFKGVNVLKRVYQIDGEQYFVTVLDGTYNRHVVHDPYYCFTGGGWTILSEKPHKLSHGEANLVKLSKDGKISYAIYWFTDGQEQYTSPVHYWWQATLRRLTLGASGSEPVLVIIQPISKETADWKKVLTDFPGIQEI